MTRLYITEDGLVTDEEGWRRSRIKLVGDTQNEVNERGVGRPVARASRFWAIFGALSGGGVVGDNTDTGL